MVEDDEMVCRSFQVAIRNNAAFSLVGKTGSQKEAMQMLLSLNVDVMLLDLELDEGDGMHLLEEMRAKLERLPEIITVTNTSSESVLSCVRELGSDFVYQKHNGAYSPENVLEIIQMTFPYYQNKTADQNTGACRRVQHGKGKGISARLHTPGTGKNGIYGAEKRNLFSGRRDLYGTGK